MNDRLKYSVVANIDSAGRVCLGSLIDRKYHWVSFFVTEDDLNKIRILPVENKEDYYEGGLRAVDSKRRVIIPAKMRGNAKRAFVAYDDDEGELVLWLQFD